MHEEDARNVADEALRLLEATGALPSSAWPEIRSCLDVLERAFDLRAFGSVAEAATELERLADSWRKPVEVEIDRERTPPPRDITERIPRLLERIGCPDVATDVASDDRSAR